MGATVGANITDSRVGKEVEGVTLISIDGVFDGSSANGSFVGVVLGDAVGFGIGIKDGEGVGWTVGTVVVRLVSSITVGRDINGALEGRAVVKWEVDSIVGYMEGLAMIETGVGAATAASAVGLRDGVGVTGITTHSFISDKVFTDVDTLL